MTRKPRAAADHRSRPLVCDPADSFASRTGLARSVTCALRMDAPRFLADAMLGRLARWLRVLGLDTAYDATAPDPVLVARAAAERRILLTRDRRLIRDLRPERFIEIHADAPLQQLRQLVDAVHLAPPAALFTRCLLCNQPLVAASDDDVSTLVPDHARHGAGGFSRCPSCGRVYWPGSHARRMRAALERALPGWLSDDV